MAFNNSSSSNQSQQLKQGGTIEEEMNSQQKKNNLIILVDKDSNDKLDELFQNTLSNKTTLHKPFKMRNLPASFFQPPSSGSKSPSVSHSRENSADSAFGSGTTIGIGSNNPTQNPIPSNHTIAPAIPSGLTIHHSRAHSSPASLGKLPLNINLNLSALTLGSATPTNSPNSTASSGNANTTNKIAQAQQQTAAAVATSNTNSNASALIASSNNQGCNNNLPQNIMDKNMQHIHARARSYDIPSLQQQLHFGDLPPGWEQAKTNDGKIYYIKYVLGISNKIFLVIS